MIGINETEIILAVFGILFLTVVIVILIISAFSYAGNLFSNSINDEYEEYSKNNIKELAKKHIVYYPEDYSQNLAKNNNADFEVDFSINTKGATVKTETIYAE